MSIVDVKHVPIYMYCQWFAWGESSLSCCVVMIAGVWRETVDSI